MSREDVQTNVRIPAQLKDQLTSSAAEDGRSLSAEVVYRIQRSYSLERELLDTSAALTAAKMELALATQEARDSHDTAGLYALRIRELESERTAAEEERNLRLEAERKLLDQTHRVEVERLNAKVEHLQSTADLAERESAALRSAVEKISDNLNVADVSFLIAKLHEDVAEKDVEIGKLRMQIAQLNANLRVLFHLLQNGGSMSDDDQASAEEAMAKAEINTDRLFVEVHASLDALRTANLKVSELRRRTITSRAADSSATKKKSPAGPRTKNLGKQK